MSPSQQERLQFSDKMLISEEVSVYGPQFTRLRPRAGVLGVTVGGRGEGSARTPRPQADALAAVERRPGG